MGNDNTSAFPKLDLYFEEATGELTYATFRESKASIARHKFSENTSGSFFVHELCILIVLAKYRGVDPLHPDEIIEFRADSDKSCWLKGLGASFNKETNKAFFGLSFGGVVFAYANRGSGHNKKGKQKEGPSFSFAHYFPKELRLESIRIYKCAQGNRDEAIQYKPEELPSLAEKIEQLPVKEGIGWESDVKRISDNIDLDRPTEDNQKSTPREGVIVQDTPFLVYTDSLMMWERVRIKIEDQNIRGIWYCVFGLGTSLINSLCKDVIRNGSSLYLMDAVTRKFGEAGPANEAAELFLRFAKELGKKPLKSGSATLFRDREGCDPALKDEMAQFFAGTHKKPLTKGFASLVTEWERLEFNAVLFVPLEENQSEDISKAAPDGAWLAIESNLLHPLCTETSCARFYDRPCAMLDMYYEELLNYFASLPKDAKRYFEDSFKPKKAQRL